MNQSKTNKAAWQKLALGTDSNQIPPGGVARVATSTPGKEPTLTQKFNTAAKNNPKQSQGTSQSASQQQINALRKKMSQPRPSLDFGTKGSVNKALNPEADRKLAKTIKEMKKTLEANKGLKEKFAKASKKESLTQTFNRSSKGRGM